MLHTKTYISRPLFETFVIFFLSVPFSSPIIGYIDTKMDMEIEVDRDMDMELVEGLWIQWWI